MAGRTRHLAPIELPPWSLAQQREEHDRFSKPIEHWLDKSYGECLLRRPDVRAAVTGVFVKFDRDRYWLHAWALMPNHAHLLFSVAQGVVLPTLLKAWKGTSSRAAGLVIRRRMSADAFWQKDYFDRMIRDGSHFWNFARHIRQNPLKSRLPENEHSLYLSE